MLTLIKLLLEELLPVLAFFSNSRKLGNKIQKLSYEDPALEGYHLLESSILEKRLLEEHERGVKVDEKTFKFTLGLSVSLTIIAAASGSFAKFFPDQNFSVIIPLVCGVSALYMLSAGIISLGAIKTLPTFGYGTQHEMELKKEGDKYLAFALLAQEKVNIIRQLRNEAAYQSLRNGFLILFAALFLSIIVLVNAVLTIDVATGDGEMNTSPSQKIELIKEGEDKAEEKTVVVENNPENG